MGVEWWKSMECVVLCPSPYFLSGRLMDSTLLPRYLGPSCSTNLKCSVICSPSIHVSLGISGRLPRGTLKLLRLVTYVHFFDIFHVVSFFVYFRNLSYRDRWVSPGPYHRQGSPSDVCKGWVTSILWFFSEWNESDPSLIGILFMTNPGRFVCLFFVFFCVPSF